MSACASKCVLGCAVDTFRPFTASRYWTMIASPVPDMQVTSAACVRMRLALLVWKSECWPTCTSFYPQGGREQSVWFRFQQIKCNGYILHPSVSYVDAPTYPYPTRVRASYPRGVQAKDFGHRVRCMALRNTTTRTGSPTGRSETTHWPRIVQLVPVPRGRVSTQSDRDLR